MPAFPRFLNSVAPRLFGTTHRDSRLYGEAGMPNAYGRSGRKRKTHGSIFDTGIVKTVDMTVEAMRASDDEVRLVVLQQNGKRAPSSAGSGDGAWDAQIQQPDHIYDGRL